MEDTYTLEQENWLEEQYSVLYKALSVSDFETAEMIILEVRANEFEKIANDMEKLVAEKKLRHA